MNMPARSSRRGFTLIELLIVMGIIGILAAIAAPNYMDALVRSKVAKFKGDAKAVEVALTSYAVDRSTLPWAEGYPVTSSCDAYGSTAPASPADGYLPRSLTTPSAYIGKVPYDYFKNLEYAGPCYPERRAYSFSCDMQNASLWRYNFVSVTYGQVKGIVMMNTPRPTTAVYMMTSPGPDGDRDFGPNTGGFPQAPMPTQFDPTNGTVSDGDLFFFGPTLGFGDDL